MKNVRSPRGGGIFRLTLYVCCCDEAVMRVLLILMAWHNAWVSSVVFVTDWVIYCAVLNYKLIQLLLCCHWINTCRVMRLLLRWDEDVLCVVGSKKPLTTVDVAIEEQLYWSTEDYWTWLSFISVLLVEMSMVDKVILCDWLIVL